MGKKVEWIDIDFKGLIPALQAGRADIAVSAIYITPERSRVVDFTDPYYAGGLVVLTRRTARSRRSRTWMAARSRCRSAPSRSTT